MARTKRKLKKRFLFLMVIILITIVYAAIIKYLIGPEIKNIYIFNNNILTDQQIIELAKIENYPNFYTTLSSSIRKRIKKNEFVKEVEVKKKFFHQIHINVKEYNILFYKNETNTYILENMKEVSYNKDLLDVPTLINYVPDEKYASLVEKLNKIDLKVLKKISEIKYDPNELDQDRFLLFMNDENYVYITLTKLDLLNKYNDAVEKLEGKKGILYLDSGNYFKIT